MTTEMQQSEKTALSTRRVLLLVLIVGLGAGILAYSVGETLAANAQSNQSLQTTNNQFPAFGPRAWHGGYDGQYGLNRTGTRLSFGAISTVSNVSVTGFNIVDGSHISVTLS